MLVFIPTFTHGLHRNQAWLNVCKVAQVDVSTTFSVSDRLKAKER